MATTTFKTICIARANNLKLGDLTKVKTGKARAELITTIANRYCEATDNNDEELRDCCVSGLMLLFWGEVKKFADTCRGISVYDYDDFFSELFIRCLVPALEKREWQKGSLNAEQCIRQSIETRGARAVIYDYNRDTRKANTNTYSLDALQDAEEEDTSSDWLEYKFAKDEKPYTGAVSLVQSYLNKKEIVQAIILDCIAFGDSTRENKEVTKVAEEDGTVTKQISYSHSFAKFGVVKSINALPEDYQQYFLDKYIIGKDVFEAGLNALKKAPNQRLYKYLDKTIEEVKTHPEMLELLLG